MIKRLITCMAIILALILSMASSLTVFAASDSGRLVSGSVKNENNRNPLIDHKFGADPFAMVYNGRVYIYMTNDSQQYDATGKDYRGNPSGENHYGYINTINVISSSDMVNWVDHGEIPVKEIAKWANNSWAPAACYKNINGKDKFFLYFADNASGIGVLEADSPIGPFREPATGSRLISWGSQASSGVTWLFDPAVFVDDDGTGYLYYGGGIPAGADDYPNTARVVKLAHNMVQLDGNAVAINAPGIFEDSGIHKANGRYYYTYCSNFSNNLASTGRGNICVMESYSPMGPFTFVGQVLSNPYSFFGIGGNNHHAFFEFNGSTYITYHAQAVTKALGFTNQGYRSTHIDKVYYDSNGHIRTITGTYTGVPQTQNLNPYVLNEAETIAWSSGITTEKCWQPGALVGAVNTKVTEIHNGDYIAVSDVDLGTGLQSITVKAQPLNGGRIEIRLDGRYGTKIGEINVSGDSSWHEYTAALSSATGVHDVYFVFTGNTSGQLFYFDNWKMTRSANSSQGSSSSGGNLIVNGGIEDGTNNWEALYGGCTLGLGYSTVKSGSLSLKSSSRGATYNGPVQTVKGFEQGATYDISAAIRFNTYENESATGETTFFMSIIYGDGKIENMATVTTGRDSWATMSGQYTVPGDADLSNVRVFIETAYTANPSAQDLVTFFVDDVSVTKVASANSGNNGNNNNNTTVNGATINDGWYYIKNTNAQKYLQVANSTGDDNVNVEIGTGDGSEAQRWYLTNVDDGYVTLQNACGAMLDVQYGEANDGTNIQTFSANGATAQNFKLVNTAEEGTYGIVTRVSGDTKGVDVYEGRTDDGTNVIQWAYYGSANQTWVFEPYVPADDSISYVTISDGWYYLKNTHAQKYLQVADTTGNNNVNVEIGSGNGSEAQRWYLTNVGDGYVTLQNACGAMLDVMYGEANDGTNIQTYSANGATAQHFKLADIGTDGTYGIVTRVSGDSKGLDVYNWGAEDSTNVIQWAYYGSANQTWTFEPYVPPVDDGNSYATLDDGWYYIKSPYANKYLQAANNAGGNGVNVEIGTGTGVAGQKWYLTNVGDGYVTLKNGKGYMLDVIYGEANDGTNIQTYSANGAAAQNFKIMKTGTNGTYGIVTRVSDDAKGLDIYNWSTADGTNVCQWAYYGNDNQMWQFELTSAPPAVTVETSTYHKISITPAQYLSEAKAISAEHCPDSATKRVDGVAYGSLTKVQYYSNTCGRVRNANIFLPADYSSDKKYPVLYVLHGYWGNEDSMCDPSDASLTTVEIISNLIASGEAEDMIVVFPYIFCSKELEHCTGMDGTNNAAYDNFINELFNDLMPYVENNYSIAKGRENTAITGFSMGGRESLYIGFSRPDVFGYIGAICPAPGVTELIPSYNLKFASQDVTPYVLLLTAGSNDTVVYSVPESYHNALNDNGVDHIWTYVNGGYHGGNCIRSNLYSFCRMIFKHRVAG